MNLFWALFMWWGSPFKNVYPLYHRITYTWHEPKRSSIAFAREKHFFFKMFLTIYHSMSRISVLWLGMSSMALNFVVFLCVCLYKIPYDQILFKKVPHSARLTSRRNVLSIHGLVNEQMGIWNGLHQKYGMIWKLGYIRTLLQSEFWVGDLLTPEQSSVGEHLGDPTGWSLIIY